MHTRPNFLVIKFYFWLSFFLNFFYRFTRVTKDDTRYMHTIIDQASSTVEFAFYQNTVKNTSFDFNAD